MTGHVHHWQLWDDTDPFEKWRHCDCGAIITTESSPPTRAGLSVIDLRARIYEKVGDDYPLLALLSDLEEAVRADS